MDKDEALAICFANLKGTKDKNLIATAKALQFLKSLPEYSSNDKVGDVVGVSGETVREFLTLLRLPGKIQDLFEQRQLRSLEKGRRLWQLARHRPELLEDTAKSIAKLSALDSRHVIDYILRNPNVTVDDAIKAIKESKTIVEHEYYVVAILSEEQYRLLSEAAQRQNLAIDVLVTSIVENWLESHSNAGQ